MRNRLLSTLLALCMVLSLLPGTARAAEVASGTCGTNLTWVSYKDGSLTISGTGPMKDYSRNMAESIGRTAPWGGDITSVVLEDGITSIGAWAFFACYSLTNATIPDSVTNIGAWAFFACPRLPNITIPDGVTTIGEGAFDSCMSLTSVIIPNSVTNIGKFAFDGCDCLASVTISNKVTSIEAYTFEGCSSLTSVTIPDSVTSIGWYAFHGCSGLTSVTIPVSVTSIGNVAFCYCIGLTSVNIPNRVTSIGIEAFSYCISLTSVTIPASVTSIGERAFSDCIGLTSINVTSGNPAYSSVDGILFNADQTLLHAYPAGKNDQSYSIPNSVTNIGSGAFSRCSGLTSVKIPKGVTSIGWRAFDYCTSLTDVYYSGSETDWKAINIDSSNSPLTNATIHYSSASDICFDQGYSYTTTVGETITFPVTVPNPNGLTLDDITFTSSDKEVAPVSVANKFDLTGMELLSFTLSVSGLKAGTVAITATATDGRSASCSVTVNASGDTGDHGSAGFSAERDGWNLANVSLSFGYPNKDFGDDKNYRIPFSRFYDVFGISLSSLVMSGIYSIPKWGGNCFGLSLLASANYNGQIDLSSCFPDKSGEGLHDYGYNEVITYSGKDTEYLKNGQQYFAVSGNEVAVAAIEKAQISQLSQEIKKAKVFKNDSSYSGLLDYLAGDAPKPILVTMGDPNHTVVIDTSVKPIESPSDPGWCYVKLYDSQSPAPSELLSNPAEWYTQESPCLLLDTKSGRFQYFRYGQCVKNSEYKYFGIPQIEFYDVSRLGNDFFTKPLTLFGNLITIQFASNDIQLLNDSNEIVFEVKDGTVITLADGYEYDPYLAGDSDTLSGSVTIPNGDFTYRSNAADVIIWSEENYYTISNSDVCQVSVDMDNKSIGVSAEEKSEIILLAQENGADGYNTFAIETTLGNNENVAIAASAANGVRITSSGSESLTLNMENSNTNAITTVVTDANDIKAYENDDEFLAYSDADHDGTYETPIPPVTFGVGANLVDNNTVHYTVATISPETEEAYIAAALYSDSGKLREISMSHLLTLTKGELCEGDLNFTIEPVDPELIKVFLLDRKSCAPLCEVISPSPSTD